MKINQLLDNWKETGTDYETFCELVKDIDKSTYLMMLDTNDIELLSYASDDEKNIREGITNQKIPCDNSAIFVVSFVSIYIQTKAKSDTSGMDASMLPMVVLRFDTSEMATIVTAERSTLRM